MAKLRSTQHRPVPAARILHSYRCHRVSFSASQTALHGILAALIDRERPGLGQWMKANMAQGFATLDTCGWFRQSSPSVGPRRYVRRDVHRQGRPKPDDLRAARQFDQAAFVAVRPSAPLFFARHRRVRTRIDAHRYKIEGIPTLNDECAASSCGRNTRSVSHKTLPSHTYFNTNPNVFAELPEKP